MKTQISLGIHPVRSEPLLFAQWVAKDPSFLHADRKDSYQTGQMSRLIWEFARRTCHFVGFVMRWLLYVVGTQWDTTVESPQHVFMANKPVKHCSLPWRGLFTWQVSFFSDHWEIPYYKYNIEISKYSWSSLSRTRLFRITAYLEVKIWSLF